MHVIYETVHGSRAYGLATPASDLDKKGVFVASPRELHGFRGGPEQVEPEKERVLYEIRKFFGLAIACNPTVIEILFTEPEDRLVVTEEGERLLANRERFLSKRARDSFGRYATAQLKRIETHRRWLLKPPEKKPERADFGLPDGRPLVTKDQRGAAEALLEKGTLAESDIPPNFVDALAREKRFAAAMNEWEQFESWKKNRNPDRAALEAQFGYDAKHASHLIRLLRMAAEILERGRVIVRRPDADELRAIRAGSLTYDQLMEKTAELSARVESLAATSALPERPDDDALDALCAEIVGRVLAKGAA